MGLRAIRKFLASPSGFTLAEALVAVGIITMALGLVGSGLFQSFSIQRSWQDDVLATKELRLARGWFAADALNASGTDLANGAPPVSSVQLTWTDTGGVPHTSIYSLSGDTLVRTFDGNQLTVARKVVSASFSRSGKMLTFALVVEAEQGGTQGMSLNTYLRMMP